MRAHVRRSCLAILLLVFAGMASAPVVTAASSAQASMPDDLLSAFLDATAEPFTAVSSGYEAHSGGVDLSFSSDGWQASAGGSPFDLRLSAFGRAGQSEPLPAGELNRQGTLLQYRRGALREWFRDTPLGLEQGFTIEEAPAGVGPLLLELSAGPGVAVTVDGDGRGLSLTNKSGIVARYERLRAADARGAALPVMLSHADGRIALQVDGGEAAYPLQVAALIYVQQQKVIAIGDSGDEAGFALAFDGDTALVGAPVDDVGANPYQGSAYVFVRTGTSWTFQQQLTAPDGAASDNFGGSVSLSGDTALVGADLDDVGANTNQGSAYVFARSGDTWSFQQQLTASDGAAFDHFGVSVSLSGDTALVGALYHDVGANTDQGSAYVFTRSGTSWTFQQQLTAPDGAFADQFGWFVSLSGDTALAGAPYDDVGANTNQGSAYVFVRSGTSWTFQQQLTAPDGAAFDFFGESVFLSGDTALVGAPYDDVGASFDQGSAYVFTRSDTTWSFQQQLVASDGAAGDWFGSSVALDGDTALVGAPMADVGASANQGAAYVFVRSGTTWSFQQKLVASDGAAGDQFGNSVSLSGDTALVGAHQDDVGANANQGSAYVFVRSGATWSFQEQLTAPDGAAGDFFGLSVALDGDTALVGAFLDDVGANANQGSAYVFVRSRATWSFQQQLVASDGAAADWFGSSVALDGDTALVGAHQDDVGANANQGAAYVFTRSGTTWSDQQKLVASDGAAGDQLGVSVSLSGNTAVVGAYQDDVGANANQGSAYVFTRSGVTWSDQQQLIAPDGAAGDWFGSSVTVEGDTALVGAYQDDVGASANQGSAYVFTRSGATWSFQQQLTASDGAAGDWFGSSVALDGDTALVGAYQDDVGANANQGSAYVYQTVATPTVVSISRAGPDPSWASTVEFTATFSEDVTGVDAADFNLTTTGTLSGPAITDVSGSGTTYTVTVATGTSCGALRLDLAGDATITNLAGLPVLDLPYTGGESYTILCALYLPQAVRAGG